MGENRRIAEVTKGSFDKIPIGAVLTSAHAGEITIVMLQESDNIHVPSVFSSFSLYYYKLVTCLLLEDSSSWGSCGRQP